jgi:membrane protein
MVKQIGRLVTGYNSVKQRLLKISLVQLLTHTFKGAVEHDAAQNAAGVSYYSILSIIPLLLGLVAIFSFIRPSVDLQASLAKFLGQNVPGANDILSQDIANDVPLRGIIGVFSILVFFWSASAMFSSVSVAINRAWHTRPHRHFLVRKAGEIGMVLGTGVLLLLSLGASAVVSIIREVSSLPRPELFVLESAGRAGAFVLMLGVFLLLYKLVPRTTTRWRDVWPGALVAAVLFEIARTLFILYLEYFANYRLIYGSIASIVVLLVWVYLSAFIMILGAEFTAQYSRAHRQAIKITDFVSLD